MLIQIQCVNTVLVVGIDSHSKVNMDSVKVINHYEMLVGDVFAGLSFAFIKILFY